MNELQKALAELNDETRRERIELFKGVFSDRLKELRQEKNYSQKTVAKKLGVAVSTYANWEQGRTEPSIYDIYNLIWVFDIEPNELFSFNEIK